MARHYYLTRSGRLRRKDNTLSFEPSAVDDARQEAESVIEGAEVIESPEDETAAAELGATGLDGMGELRARPGDVRERCRVPRGG